MADESDPRYRLILFHAHYKKPRLMMAYWTVRAPEHSTKAAEKRLDHLRHDGKGIPNPNRCIITRKDKVHTLPLRPVIPAVDSDLPLEKLESIAASLADTTDVLLFGEYGTFAEIICWNAHGIRQADPPHDWFVPQPDINILDGTFIDSNWKRMFLYNQ